MEKYLNEVRNFLPKLARPSGDSRQILAASVGIGSLMVAYKLFQASRRLPCTGKAIFISGCDSGFGRAAAIEFHRLGFVVFAGCLNEQVASESTFSDLIASEAFHIVSLDVTKQTSVEAAALFVLKWLQNNVDFQLWAIINNAGISTFGPVEFTSMETFEKVMNCNYFGAIRICKAFLPLMRRGESNGGRVVFMGSIGGHLPCPFTSAYGATKASILFLADTLAMELALFDVKVSSLLPDFYKTNIMEPSQALHAFNAESLNASEGTKKQYGGEEFLNRLRRFLTEVSPPRAKEDLRPVINAMVHAVCAIKPRRRYYPMEFVTKIATYLFDFAPQFYLSAMKNFI